MNTLNLEIFQFDKIKDVFDDIDDDYNLPLIIGLSSGLGILFFILLILTIYLSFFNNGGSIFLGSNFNIPGEFDDEENRRNEEVEYLPKLSDIERQNYFDAKDFQERFPPDAKPLGSSLSEIELQYIHDRGIQAYFFEQPLELSHPNQSILVEDKLDVRFISDSTSSVILNNPLPVKNDTDTVYFEVKLFQFPTTSKVSIGLSSKPYPLFRLPGYNRYSIGYESDGVVRINQPFYSPAIWNKLIEGDVLGVGFKPRSGTVFFTHNGKKILEAVHNVKLDLFPIIGSIGPSKLDVNLGQLGFVFIEANVKKWGFGSVFGTIGVPPAYGKETANDAVLDKGEELPPTYPSEEETFFGPSALLHNNGNSSNETDINNYVYNDNDEISQVRKPTKVISKPPSYSDEPKENLNSESSIKNVDEVSERLYERRSSAFDQENNHYDPLNPSTLQSPSLPTIGGSVDEELPLILKDVKYPAQSKPDQDTTVSHPSQSTAEQQTTEHLIPSETQKSTTEASLHTDSQSQPIVEEPQTGSTSNQLEESTAEESPEATPEPQTRQSTPSSSGKNSQKNKKKKKKSKKKGRK